MVNPFAPPEAPSARDPSEEALSAELAERTLSFGRLLAISWTIWVNRLPLIAPLAFVVYVPLNFLIGVASDQSTGMEYETAMSEVLVSTGLGTFVGTLVTIAATCAVEMTVAGREVALPVLLQAMLRRWLPVVWTGVLFVVALFLGMAFLLVPGIFVLVIWGFAESASILREESGLGAFRYSQNIVEGRGWLVFGYVVLLALMQVGIGLGFTEISDRLPEHRAVWVVFETIGDVVLTFFVVAHAVFFLNLDYLTHRR